MNIYIIRNTQNDVVYIGKTTFPIYKRFCEHICSSYLKKSSRKLYTLMREIGQENFYVELLEVCEKEESSLRENYYMNKFMNNCNETRNFPLNKEELEKEISKKSSREICKEYGIHDKSVVIYWCKKYGIDANRNRFGYKIAPELTEDLLYKEYIINNKSINKIREEYGLKSNTSIKSRLRKYNIRKRLTINESNSAKILTEKSEDNTEPSHCVEGVTTIRDECSGVGPSGSKWFASKDEDIV